MGASQGVSEPSLSEPSHPDYPLNRYVWTIGDLQGLATAVSKREVGVIGAARWLGQTLWSFVAADVHITWTRRDPAPVIMLSAKKLLSACKFRATSNVEATLKLEADRVRTATHRQLLSSSQRKLT